MQTVALVFSFFRVRLRVDPALDAHWGLSLLERVGIAFSWASGRLEREKKARKLAN